MDYSLSLMLTGFWDFIFNRDVISTAIKWSYEETQKNVDKALGINVFFSTFFIFLFAYIYLYVQAIRGYVRRKRQCKARSNYKC